MTGVSLLIFQTPDNYLHVIACDVGQGDAILVTYKNTQILSDGGPNDKVLDCLSKHLPLWDRQIELVVSTHPDSDHSTGLVEVIKRYKVDTILINNLNPGTQVYKALESAIGSRGVRVVNPREGMALRLGMIHLDILHPDEGFEDSKTNQYSIPYILKYGNFEAIFTGDFEQKVSDSLANNYLLRSVEYIKIPHHGSRNGLTENLLKALEPKVAVISVGKNNPYKHPHQEILDLLGKYNVDVLRTDEMGDVEIVTDGESMWVN